MKKLKFFIFMFFLISCFSFSETRWVISTGQATIINKNTSLARDEAIIDARVKALESCGVSVDSRTVITGIEMIDHTLITRTKGFIEKYEILKEWKKEGIYYVKIKASVVSNVSPEKAKEYQKPWKVLAYIKITVNGEEKEDLFLPDFITLLEKNNYEVPYTEKLKSIKKWRSFKNAVKGNVWSMVYLGKRFPSRIVIFGKINSELSSKTESPSYFNTSGKIICYRTEGFIKAVEVKTGKVIVSYSTPVEGIKGFGNTDKIAYKRSIDKTVDEIKNKIMPELAEYRKNKKRIIDIYAFDIPEKKEYDYLKNLISHARWVHLKSASKFSPSLSKFTVEYSEDTYFLTSFLQQDKNIVIKDFDWDKIVIKWIKNEKQNNQ